MLMPTLNNQLNANVEMKKKLSKYANNFYKNASVYADWMVYVGDFFWEQKIIITRYLVQLNGNV